MPLRRPGEKTGGGYVSVSSGFRFGAITSHLARLTDTDINDCLVVTTQGNPRPYHQLRGRPTLELPARVSNSDTWLLFAA